MVEPLWKIVSQFLRKLKIELPYDPAISLLHIYPDKTIIQKDTRTPLFIASLLTIAETWEQPKRPPTGVDKADVAHIYMREYYSSIRRDEMLPFVATWVT